MILLKLEIFRKINFQENKAGILLGWKGVWAGPWPQLLVAVGDLETVLGVEPPSTVSKVDYYGCQRPLGQPYWRGHPSRTQVLQNPGTPLPENPRTPLFENSTAPLLVNLRTPFLENPGTLLLENPGTTLLENLWTTLLENPWTTLKENPRTPPPENLRSPLLENLGTPFLENPETPFLENPGRLPLQEWPRYQTENHIPPFLRQRREKI